MFSASKRSLIRLHSGQLKGVRLELSMSLSRKMMAGVAVVDMGGDNSGGVQSLRREQCRMDVSMSRERPGLAFASCSQIDILCL